MCSGFFEYQDVKGKIPKFYLVSQKELYKVNHPLLKIVNID